MIIQSSNHIGFVIRNYLAAIYLGLFLATSIIPQGYMPLVNHEGSVQFVACSDTGKTVPTKSHAIESTYDCPFSLLQLSILPFPGPIPFPAGNSFFESSYFSYNLPERNYKTTLPRGPPPTSWMITNITYSGETHENHINWAYGSPNVGREFCDEQWT